MCNPHVSPNSSTGSGSAIGRTSTSGAFQCWGSDTDYIGINNSEAFNPDKRHWAHFFDASLSSSLYTGTDNKLHPDRVSCKFFICYK